MVQWLICYDILTYVTTATFTDGTLGKICIFVLKVPLIFLQDPLIALLYVTYDFSWTSYAITPTIIYLFSISVMVTGNQLRWTSKLHSLKSKRIYDPNS